MSGSRRIRVHALVDGLGAGGAELLVADFARVAESVDVELSVGALRGDQNSPAAVRLRRAGVEPTLIPVRSLWRPRDVRRLETHLATVRPDILHTHLGYADVLGGLAARRLAVPVVSTVHADWWGGGLRQRARYRLMALARRHCAELVIAVSDSARRAYLTKGWDKPERVITLRNGLSARSEARSGKSVREELGLEPDAVVMSMISRVAPEKGHDVAIAAMEQLRGRFPSLRLLIVGDGTYLPEVRRMGASLGEALRVVGHRDDVMRVLDASDILLQPSRFDAFPTTLLEAMEASVPIVASAIGGIPEMVDHGVTGVLVEPPPEAVRFTEALVPLLSDDELRARLGEAGRERVRREFSADGWARRTREIYDSVLGGGPKSG